MEECRCPQGHRLYLGKWLKRQRLTCSSLVWSLPCRPPCEEGPVCKIWIYKNLKISLAYLLTKYSVYFEGCVWGVKTKGNKRKGKHVLGSTKHTGFRGNCLLQFVPLCWFNQEDTEKEHEGRIEATTSHLQGKKENPGISVWGKPLLEAKQNLDYNQLFRKQLIVYGVQLLTYHQKQ